jgi:hypothetical protein
MSDRNLLFYGNSVHDVFAAHTARATQMVDQIQPGQFAASSDDQLVEHILESVRIEHLVLHEDRMTMTDQESKMDVSHDFRYGGFRDERVVVASIRVMVNIPYTGDESLWRVTPNPHYMNYPRADTLRKDHQGVGTLVITIERTVHSEPNEYQEALERELTLIRDFLDSQKKNIDQHHATLPTHIRSAVQDRRKRLDGQASIRKMLNISMAPRPGMPAIQPIAAPRKIVRPLPPALPSRPDWGLREEDYEHIVSVIRHEGVSFETTPATFSKLDEEELRDVILAHLNGHYQGEASGERFRKHGKTDICIEVENRAAFIAECKIWRGAKECAATADQLLSYVTWRDCRCSMVFFNKDVKGFTDIQIAAADALRKHPLFVSDVGGAPPGEWRFRFRQKDDEKRLVTVHVFLFNLYQTPRTK